MSATQADAPEEVHVQVEPERDGIRRVRFSMRGDAFTGEMHEAPNSQAGAIMVGGVGGGFTGPASVYADLAEALRPHGITSLRLDFRHAGDLTPCIEDVLVADAALADMGITRLALVGWSFGGAVVITAGSLSEHVVGVATVASQSYGTEAAADLGPRPLLILHGDADRTLPVLCSQDIYRRASGPKEIEIFPGANHGLDQARDQMKSRLQEFIVRVLSD